MKVIFTICLSVLLFSCLNNDRETREMDQLDQRITRLEQKIDSLISGKNINSIGLNKMDSRNSVSYGTVRETGRCQAITKKGTQCKRKARHNGSCWQHGG